MKRQMPGVAPSLPDVRDEIERHQPYYDGQEWLGHLVTLTNENKHKRLTPQERTETTRLSPGPGGGVIGLSGGAQIRMGHGASIQIGQGASISFGGTGAPIMQSHHGSPRRLAFRRATPIRARHA